MKPIREICLLLLLLVGAAAPICAQEPPRPSEPVVVTIGQATVTAVPDRAFITISAQSRSKNSVDAQRQNAEAMNAVLQGLQKAGVGKDAIKTIGYELQPDFDYTGGRQVFRGYLARNTVEVRVDDIDQVGTVIDAASGGATTIGGIRFEVRNRETLERDALRLAVADARARADAMAAGAGRTIDRVVRIEEGGVPEYPMPMMRMTAAASAEQASTPVSPSTVDIRARVTLTAALRSN